jgi:endonuclease III related protein
MAIMPTLDDAFPTVYAALVEHFGPPEGGFEGLAPFEAMIAVLLDRTLAKARARAALDVLDRAGLLSPQRLAEADLIEIRDALLTAGLSTLAKSLAPLKRLAQWVVNHERDGVDSLVDPHQSTDLLRRELAAVSGIGVAGADAMLLFALQRPSYPVDRATFRVLVRHDWLDPTESYEEARDLVVDRAASCAQRSDLVAASLLQYLSLCMDQLGRRYCRAAAPRCDGCPLEKLLPEGGPRELDA